MRSFAIYVALATLACPVDDPKARVHPGAAGKVKDRAYVPKIGDRVAIGSFTSSGSPAEVLCCSSRSVLADYAKAVRIKDKVGREEILAGDSASYEPHGTPVLVLELDDLRVHADEDIEIPYAVVRFLEGSRKGEKVYVFRFAVMQLMTREAEENKAKRDDPARKLLAEAANLERGRQYRRAAETYQELILKYPKSDSVKEAGEGLRRCLNR